MKLLAKFICLFSVLFIFSQCSRTEKPELIDAKVIVYRVEYIEEEAGSIPTNILPRKMTLVFADNKAMNNIEGFLGQFSLTYIADLKKRSVTTLLKIFDNHYYYQGSVDELPAGIDGLEGMELEKTGDTKTMMNMVAEKYILHLPGDQKKEIWGTSEIQIKDPNITTPYRELEKVLLQFYTELSVLKMLVKAEKYEEREISTSLFDIPQDYERISRLTMEKTLAELFK